MARVLFLVYHGIGHFNPCFSLAKILTTQYEVAFAGFVFFQQYVEHQGFHYHPLKTVPFGLGFETWVNEMEKKRNIYWHSLKDRWSDRLYRARESELKALIDHVRPDYVLIDSLQSTDFIVLYPVLKQKEIKVAILHTSLSTVVEPDLPPLNSSSLPDKSVIDNSHREFRLKALKKSLLQWIKYQGKDNDSIVRKWIRKNNIPRTYISSKPALFSLAFENIDQFVMSPEEFEFPSRHRSPYQHFLGFMADDSRKEELNPFLENLITQMEKEIPTGKRLVYCSFGTVAYDDSKPMEQFIEKLFTVVNQSGFILIVSGNLYDILKAHDLPGNIHILKKISHFKVFPLASVFITHGGFNSVKESIHAGVPLLVYPIDARTDQNGNSARVVYHKLGLRGDLEKDSVEDIRQKISTILSDTTFKNNIENFNRIDRSYSAGNFLKILERTKPLD